MSHTFLGAQNSLTRIHQRGQHDPQRTLSPPPETSNLDGTEENGSILLTVERADGATFRLKVSQHTTGLEIKVMGSQWIIKLNSLNSIFSVENAGRTYRSKSYRHEAGFRQPDDEPPGSFQ